MKRFIFILTTILALSSCEYEFEIAEQMSDSQTYIRFTPSNECDTSFLFIQATTPLKDGDFPMRTEGENINVLVNGRALDLEKVDLPGDLFASKIYATTCKFKPGDEIELEAKLPGRETVSASATVPPDFPLSAWTYKIDVDPYYKDQTACFQIEYDNAPGNSGRYAVEVLEELTGWVENLYEQGVTGNTEWRRSDTLVIEQAARWYSPVSYDLSYIGQEPLIFHPATLNRVNRKPGDQIDTSRLYREAFAWSDIPEMAGEKGLYQIYIKYRKDEMTEWYQSTPWKPAEPVYYKIGQRSITNYRYKLRFYSFDEASFKYQKAQTQNSVISGMSLAPASMTYTNIVNGIGVCGAYTVSETDWFKITE